MNRLLLLLFFTPLFSYSQFTSIPDANFEQALIDLGHDTGTPDGQVLTANISGVTSLDVHYKSISDLSGIEDFTALTILSCRTNYLTSLDVTQNTALTDLACSSNQLTSLDVTQNTALTYLDCSGNQLTSVDVTQNTALTLLNCGDNNLASLDVSQNTALTDLSYTWNHLTSLDVSQNTALTTLYGNYNELTSLDVSQNTALTTLYCWQNLLTCLNVQNGNNTNLNLNASSNLLTCIEVDDVAYSTANWTVADGNIDAGVTFSINCNNACSSVGISEYSNQPRKLVRIMDMLGRETTFKPNTPLIYQYDDGSVAKTFVVE